MISLSIQLLYLFCLYRKPNSTMLFSIWYVPKYVFTFQIKYQSLSLCLSPCAPLDLSTSLQEFLSFSLSAPSLSPSLPPFLFFPSLSLNLSLSLSLSYFGFYFVYLMLSVTQEYTLGSSVMSWNTVSLSSPPIDWTLLAPDVPELKVE